MRERPMYETRAFSKDILRLALATLRKRSNRLVAECSVSWCRPYSHATSTSQLMVMVRMEVSMNCRSPVPLCRSMYDGDGRSCSSVVRRCLRGRGCAWHSMHAAVALQHTPVHPGPEGRLRLALGLLSRRQEEEGPVRVRT